MVPMTSYDLRHRGQFKTKGPKELTMMKFRAEKEATDPPVERFAVQHRVGLDLGLVTIEFVSFS